MFRLANGIGGVAVMICTPKQAGTDRGGLPLAVIRIAIETRISAFVNDADNSLPLHGGKVHSHQIVMRKIDDAVPRLGADQQRLKHKKNPDDGKLHRAISSNRRAMTSAEKKRPARKKTTRKARRVF